MIKFILQILGVVLVCYCLVGAVFYFFQEKMLFFPMGTAFGNCPQMDRYRAKAVESDGLRYYLKKSPSAVRVLVIFHGNAGSACDRTYFFDLLSGLDADIVLFEYPGYGMDKTPPGEKQICQKALEMVTHIKASANSSYPVFLVGESLGTGVATWVSTQTRVAGLILISAYTAIADVARYHYPWLPVNHLLKHKFLASLWAAQTPSPAILFHGVDDDIIPIQFARQQIKNFTTSARLFEIENCGHNDIVDTGKNLILKQIIAFVSAVH